MHDTPDQATPQAQRAARIVLAAALVILGLYILQGFLRALLWAAVLVVATWPLYRRAERRLPQRGRNVLLPALFTLAAALLVLAPLALIALRLAHEAAALAAWLATVRTNGLPLPAALAHLPFAQHQINAWWQANLASPEAAHALLGRLNRGDLLQTGRNVGSNLLHRAVLFGFTLLALFFLYRDGRTLRAQMLAASARAFGPHGERIARQMVASIHGTVDGLILVGLGVGLILGIAYAIAGVPSPALLGAATAIGAMLPFGSFLALLIAAALLVAAGKTLAAIILLAIGSAVIFIADHFVRPALIGGATRLPFIWVLLGILGGIETFGILGLFLGPAVMAALILLWREWANGAKTISAS